VSRVNYQKNFSSKIGMGSKENKNPAGVRTHKKDFGWNVSKPIWHELPGTPSMVETPDGAGLCSHGNWQGLGRDHVTSDRAHYLDEMSHVSLGETCEKQSCREETVRRIAGAPPTNGKSHKESEDSPWVPDTTSETSSSLTYKANHFSPDDKEEQAAGCFYGSGPCAAVHASTFMNTESAIVAEPLEPLYALTLCEANRFLERRRDYNCPVRSTERTDLGARKTLHEIGHIHAIEPLSRRWAD